MEVLCINSFLKNGHTFDIYSYDYIKGLPNCVNQIDANIILTRSKIFADSAGSIASFSDWFRYKLLYEKGGWWVDLDVICLKPFDIKEEFCFATEKNSAKYGTGVTNAVIKASAKSEFLQVILSYIESINNYGDVSWGEFGPVLLHSVLKSFDSKKFIKPVKTFLPIDWNNVLTLIDEKFEIPKKSLAIHLWNNLWRINSLNKNASYHPDCIYEKLKSLYL